MTANNFEKISRVFQPPIYTFRPDPVGLICDKFDEPDGFEFKRTRYIIVGNNQCTCQGYVQTKDCKHLKMLRKDYSWIKKGVTGATLVETVKELVNQLGDVLPESAKKWNELELGDISASEVKCVELAILDQTKKKAERIVGMKTFHNKTQLAVVFLFDELQ